MLEENQGVFIVAELSANHGGSLDTAIETIKAAKRAGADAIKLQTSKPELITLDVKTEDFKIQSGTLWDGAYLYDLYKEAYTPWEWHKVLFDVANSEGLVCFSSPFSLTAVDFLETLDNPIYKVASFEITDIPLIEYIASKGKPIILSTGIAEFEDIQLAIETCRKQNNHNITILKCTSSYPAPIDQANLVMIQKIAEDFNVKVGLSDHTLGNVAPVLSVAFGATMIEKHFILDKSIGGPDADFSLDEKEFTKMVTEVRNAEKAIGQVGYELTEKQIAGKFFARSLYIAEDVKAGDKVTLDNVRSVRPGYGLHPKYLPRVLGKNFKRDYKKGVAFSLEQVK